MTTFYDLIKELALLIADARQSVSTGGSTTTLVDTALGEADTYYNGGVLLIDQGTPAAPRVTSYASSSGTFTFSAIATAVGSGISYTAVHARFPLDILKTAINQGLLEAERYMEIDETVTLVAEQEKYALPTGVNDVRRVELGTANEGWDRHYAWTIEDGYLRFIDWVPSDPSQTCRIHHAANHASLSALADVLDERVSRRRLIVSAAKNALNWRVSKVGNDEPNTTNQLNYYLNLDKETKRERVSHLLERDPILARY